MSTYKPCYVDYWKNSGTNLNIDDYTRLTGCRLFSSDKIYAPLTIAVSLNPDVAYNLQVDTTRKDWNSVLCSGVKKMMDVPPSSKVSIRDDRGRDISTLHLSELREVGLVYPHTENVGRLATSTVKIGDVLEVPSLLSTTKRSLFSEWMADAEDRIVSAVTKSLSQCTGVTEVGDRLTLKSKDSIKAQISRAMTPGFDENVDVHSTDPDVDVTELSNQVSNLIMASIVEGFKHNKERVREHFEAEDAELKAKSSEDEVDPNIFKSPRQNVGASLREGRPDRSQLFSDIVQGSLERENIGNHTYYMIVRGGKRPKPRASKKKHHHHRSKAPVHHKKHRRRHKGHKGRGYEMFTSNKGLYYRSLEKENERRGRPSYRKSKKKKKHHMRHKSKHMRHKSKHMMHKSKHECVFVDIEPNEGSIQRSTAPGLYSAGPPSLESVRVDLLSTAPVELAYNSSLEPIYMDAQSEAPSLEPIYMDAQSEAPSLEPIYMAAQSEAPSLEPIESSIEPIPTKARAVLESVPELESVAVLESVPELESVAVLVSVPELESVASLDQAPSLEPISRKVRSRVDSLPALESFQEIQDDIPDVEPIWSDEEYDSPPALEAVGLNYSSSEEEFEATPMRAKVSKPKFRRTVPAPVQTDIQEVAQSSGGLPSLSNLKRELGLQSTQAASNLEGKYSATIDGPIYQNAMKVMCHYGKRKSRRRRGRHHHHHRHGRRGVRIIKDKYVMGPISSQEIQELDQPEDIEEYIAPFVASSYEEKDGRYTFTTADGKMHTIRPDGIHFVDGQRLPFRVEKMIEQDMEGEPVLLVLERSK